MQKHLILASSSPFRRELLSRLNVEFECYAADIDESQRADEPADRYVLRLAAEKAAKIADLYPGSVVIGSDQCALLDGQILGKPGNHENAMRQLKQAQGKTVTFYTGLCVIDRSLEFRSTDLVLYEVDFRSLSDQQLDHYLQVETPYNCAGSFKSEGYGVCLFDAMRGDDPSALIGLPLIRLISMLEEANFSVV